MRRAAWAFLAGVLVTLGYLGTRDPETIITTGLRLQAMRQEWDWQAVPREAQPVTYSTRDLLAYEEAPAVKPAKRKR